MESPFRQFLVLMITTLFYFLGGNDQAQVSPFTHCPIIRPHCASVKKNKLQKLKYHLCLSQASKSLGLPASGRPKKAQRQRSLRHSRKKKKRVGAAVGATALFLERIGPRFLRRGSKFHVAVLDVPLLVRKAVKGDIQLFFSASGSHGAEGAG